MNLHEPLSNKSQDRQHPPPKDGRSSRNLLENVWVMEHYADMIDRYQSDRFSPFQLKEEQLAAHQIRYLDNAHSLLLKDQLKLKKTDCLFSILKTQFNGVEYMYQVFMGPFVLRILVLNLNRNSDDGDEDICKEEIGSGGFGSVRAVRIGEKSYAIKRIPFKFKLDPTIGYDFQAQTSEQAQLRRCLREFCVFKICSLLGIGPLLTPSGYDLVCFSNCIEFRMQLCETISSKQFYLAHEDVSLDQIKEDLFVRLAKLHSLHIVHRDIKPDNMLFSPARKAFVLGDFGMSLLIKEGFKEKTMTSFAGTPNFCGEEMKRLLNGERGLVNLYLNDLYALQESLSFFEQNLMGEDSEISRNSMSYNGQNYDDLSDFQNFSMEHSNGSFRNPTDGAYSSTGQSLVNFTTASTEAPKKEATSINHHQAQIIFQICRKLQRKEPFDRDGLYKEIFDRLAQYQSYELVENLAFEIVTLFFQTKTAVISNGLKEWKHASRHYGPTNEFTIQLMARIIETLGKEQNKGSETIRVSLMQIQQQLIRNGEGTRVNRVELMYYRSVGHYLNYNYSFINYMRHQLTIQKKKSQQSPKLVIEEAEFLAKGFLFFCKGREITSRQVYTMHYLFMRYFQDPDIIQDFNPKCKDLAYFCYQFLAMRKVLTYEDVYYYILYCLNFSQTSLIEVKELLQSLITMHESNSQDLRLSACVSTLCINISDNYPQYMQIAEEVLLVALQRMEKQCQSDSIFLKLQLMILYNKKEQNQKVLTLNNEVALGIQTYKINIIQWKYFDLIRLNTIAQSCLKLKDYRNSHIYYLQSLHYLQTHYSQQKVHQLFQVMNNLIFIHFQQKQYNQAYKYLSDLREILQQSDREEFLTKRVYVYQQIITLKVVSGLKEEDKGICIEMIRLIVENIFRNIDPTYFKLYKKLIGVLDFKIEAGVKHFLEKETVKALSNEQYRLVFKDTYLSTNLQIGRYLIRDLGYNQLGLRYLWNYIDFLNNHPYLLTETDYFVYNLFATILMKCNSYRRAILFLQGYIFRIPTCYFSIKKRAFSLIYKASTHVNDRFARYYYQLVRNNYMLLMSKDYGGVVQKERSVFKRRLMRKWFEKI